jgi:electron transport complex protein RnfG
MKEMIKPAFALFIITAISTALLGYARNLTLEPAEIQRKKVQERTLKEVLPQAASFTEIPAAKKGSIEKIYEGKSGGETVGYVIELAPVGYSGAINMMVGISKTESKVIGMRVLKHSETPGLGANAVKESFHRQFNNKNLVELIVVKTSARSHEEIEAITASTITTRAITNAVNEAIAWYNGEVQ